MAWSVFIGTINPGTSQGVAYSWDGYHGVQVARARPLNPGSQLRVSNQGQRLDEDGSYTYFVTVRNVGSLPVSYELTGDRV